MGGEFVQKRALHIPRYRLAPRVAGDEHDAAMPQCKEVPRRGYVGRHLVQPRAGELQPVRAAIQREAGSRLRGKPFEHFARTGDHDPGIGRVLAEMADDAPNIMLEFDLGLAHEKQLVFLRAKVALNP